MKATNLAIWSLAVLIATGFTACKKDDMKITEPHMTLTTAKNKGEKISLGIGGAAEDQADVWIDLNNNGIEDSGEADIYFNDTREYPLGAQTITIYGKVIWLICHDNRLTSLNVSNNPKLEGLYCYNNQLTSLDLSNNPKLEELWCHGNQITTLDVSKNTNLRRLLCFNNSIYGSNMTALVNSLPTRNAGNEGDFYVVNRNGDGNVCTPAQVNIAKNKNWDVKDSGGNTYSGSK